VFAGIRESRKFTFYLVIILLVINLFTLLLIPPEVYAHYINVTLHGITANTELNTYNQSLTASVLRFTGLYQGGWGITEIPLALKVINSALFIFFVIFAGFKIFRTESTEQRLIYTMMILAVVPVFSPLGWGHLYILSMPLLIYLIFKHRNNVLIFLVFLCFAADIPDSMFSSLQSDFPSKLFSMRFMLGVFVMIGFVFFHDKLKDSPSSNVL
jgi:hypothetical protein